jgi:choline dehydrogenase-like flavoprotein
VGAGAAGITLAHELSGTSSKVLLVESGGFELDPRTQSLYAGQNVGAPYFLLDACRLRFFGGTTNHWAGLCGKLSAIDLAERPWIKASGWPFGLAELEPYYERARPLLAIENHPSELSFWEDPHTRPRFRLRDVRQQVNIFSPPVRFGQEYRKTILDSRNVTLMTNANVLELEAAGSGSAVARAKLACLEGPRFSVTARQYVLATGGVENARLLLLSNRHHPAGLGNAHDLVGRYFAEHPMPTVGELLPSDPFLPTQLYSNPRIDGLFGQVVLTLDEEVQRQEKLAHCSYILLPETEELKPLYEETLEARERFQEAIERLPPQDFEDHLEAILRDIDGLLATWKRREESGRSLRRVKRFTVLCRPEQLPNPESRVTLSQERDALGKHRVQLDWRLLPEDKRSARLSLQTLAHRVGEAGLGRVKVRLDEDYGSWSPPRDQIPWNGPPGSNHHMGTTRMHTDPRRGVVDENCRVHGVENLYVAGSSVFPTGGHVPPTLTIVALAVRLADHLKEAVRG